MANVVCFMCHDTKPEEETVLRKDRFGEMRVCRPCFDDAMYGDFDRINRRREMVQIKIQMTEAH